MNLVGQRHLVVGQPVVELVMQGAIVQQRLTTVSLEATEVLVEVARELNSVVILKGLVQQLHQTVEGIALLHILQRESSTTFQAVPLKLEIKLRTPSVSCFNSFILVM